MAYLRPLNSSEANLFVIRFTSPLVTSSKLTVLSGSYTGYYAVNASGSFTEVIVKWNMGVHTYYSSAAVATAA